MKMAVLHDKFAEFGGGEFVSSEIAKTLQAPLYTPYVTPEAKSLTKGCDVIPFKQDKYLNLWYSKLIHRELIETTLIVFDFEQLDLSNYDIIFSSGVLSRSYIPTADQYVINYMHSPPRWLYDIYRERIDMLRWYQPKLLAKFWFQWWRTLDLTVDKYVNKYVTNSEVTQKRIRRYFGRDSEVIYPPVYTQNYKWNDDKGYFLTISRSNPEKRLDVIIKAFRDLPNEKLYVAGSGTEKYKNLAKGCTNIRFLGSVSESLKQKLLSNCSALISIPMEEDFGISVIESFASGKPVIGVKEGFTRYQIDPYTNGLFVSRVTPSGLKKAIKDFHRCNWNVEKIQAAAKKYDISIFRENIKEVVKRKNE
jgi:glycosyltransferase involved in cell wall biosynthesis